TSTPEYDEQLTFDFYAEAREDKDIDYELIHKRWDWVLDEMIFAFEHKVDDSWEDAFSSGEHDILWVETDKLYDGKKTFQMKKGPNDTYVCDYDGIQKVHDRMQNGFRLFGKYYQGLWD
ncbi:MAG: Nitrincola phage, partial [Candidatus Parcubacteria bacterium]